MIRDFNLQLRIITKYLKNLAIKPFLIKLTESYSIQLAGSDIKNSRNYNCKYQATIVQHRPLQNIRQNSDKKNLNYLKIIVQIINIQKKNK